ncbi:MAG: thioredoxin domain-containing protein [Acidobacteria bacterium]|nr:thioredoxin domain-containing protein [Acidobacteriota bacterium]MBS1866123.1 thioredoxin domain-containing protein [Acidobacteriota bacterium]
MSWQRIQAGMIAIGLLAAVTYLSLGGHMAQAAPPKPQPQTVNVPDVDPHKAFGQKSAPVVLEIFSDFQCPACRQYYVGTNRQLLDNYVNTGKVYLIHRDFPLPMHAYSRVAARYARAAALIGKFEKVEDALFQNQQQWDQTGDVDGIVASALTSAEMTKVRALVKNDPAKLDALIEKDVALGRTYNVSQTPTSIFHANGQTYPYGGGIDYQFLKQFLDQLIGQK